LPRRGLRPGDNMELFTGIIPAVYSFLEEQAHKRTWPAGSALPWPVGGSRNIVLKEDIGLELGNPAMESVSCLLWTEKLSLIEDGRVTLVGPDFFESAGESLPFGKVVLVGAEGFDEDNVYDRHKDMDFLRYDLDLQGFMMRAVSQYMREWCRISREALSNGFSANILGSSLIGLLQRKPYVKSVEVIFITSTTSDVTRIKDVATPAEKILSAMNKMASEMDFECGSCDFQEVCDEAEGLKGMRDRLMERKKEQKNG
jgi:CO dehydrogenase/acetyl-CoA synthase beta subunit